jgi:hypothetical protein
MTGSSRPSPSTSAIPDDDVSYIAIGWPSFASGRFAYALPAIDPADATHVPAQRNLEVVEDVTGRRLVLATSTYVFERLDRAVPGLRWLMTGIAGG